MVGSVSTVEQFSLPTGVCDEGTMHCFNAFDDSSWLPLRVLISLFPIFYRTQKLGIEVLKLNKDNALYIISACGISAI